MASDAERKAERQLYDGLDRLALLGTKTLCGLSTLILIIPALLTTLLGGILAGIEILVRGHQHRPPISRSPGIVGGGLRLGHELLGWMLRHMSGLWYRHRWARLLLLLPGWALVVVSHGYLTLMPFAAAYPGAATPVKKWHLALIDSWPLTVHLQRNMEREVAWHMEIDRQPESEVEQVMAERGGVDR